MTEMIINKTEISNQEKFSMLLQRLRQKEAKFDESNSKYPYTPIMKARFDTLVEKLEEIKKNGNQNEINIEQIETEILGISLEMQLEDLMNSEKVNDPEEISKTLTQLRAGEISQTAVRDQLRNFLDFRDQKPGLGFNDFFKKLFSGNTN